ncbi:unnamed protein product [Eruca vesicaria subsp. sativa]|uniref:Jacalin-type lectin domain-containing protein n=1 Tax=Eruca vesicaria subsp. sativa TaxID=29727 RepID=A0ABC8LMQ4_ERUVS|nr:unnamed protein product [Eruca vesicaria subsp. sativa]
MTERLEAKGIYLQNGNWDDGDHDGVSKIYIGCGSRYIHCVYFDYVKSGKSIEGSFHGVPAFVVEINLLENEHLESVSGIYNSNYGIYSLAFQSNFKTIGPIMPMPMGETSWEAFTLAVKGKKITGFHGSAYNSITSLGAYFNWITPTRVEAKGGKGGKAWDDGYEHEDVSMIHVRGGYGGIHSMQFTYVRNGELKRGPLRGISTGGYPVTYELKDEYLVSVEGYYDENSRVIQGIQFRTNTRTLEMMGYPKGRKFTVATNGNKIIGFHGYADKSALISIGAYFTTIPCKLEGVGDSSKQGLSWDDGSGYDGIRTVIVDAFRSSYIACIRFEYENRGKEIKNNRRWGSVEREEEFVIDYPNEFITSVEGSIDERSFICSLTIKTSKGRTSPTFGDVRLGSRFVLEKPGNVLVGFHGKVNDGALLALGAYYRPFPLPPDTEKLEEEGGDGGDYWDDGNSFIGIGKIYIGLTQNAIASVKFMYVQHDDRIVFGDDHGSKTLSDIQEFTIDDPTEYLTSVEGDYDDKSGVITMLRFITNRPNSSRVFGFSSTSSFTLHKSGHKIVGFHGRSSNMLHQLGVHVLPIN